MKNFGRKHRRLINLYKNNLQQFGKTDIGHSFVVKSGEKGQYTDFLQGKVTSENISINKHAIFSNFLRVAGGSK